MMGCSQNIATLQMLYKTTLACVHNVYMKHKSNSPLGMVPIPKLVHRVHRNIRKSKPQTHWSQHFDKGYSISLQNT